MDTVDRWTSKADAYVAGYQRVFGVIPSKHNVISALCVAEFETRCGDALDGNWGGTTVAQLTTDERNKLHVANLSPSNPDDLKAAQQLLGAQPNKVLGQDSDPTAGWYWIWFYHPATPADGAAYFIKVLVAQRSTCRFILDDDDGTLDALVRAMYATHYFSGHYNPHSPSVTYAGKQVTGDEANIDTYRDSLIRIQPGIVTSLSNWIPACAPYDLSTTEGLQEALTYLARAMNRPELDPHGIDGKLGSQTEAAIIALQRNVDIKQDGVPGSETKNAIMTLISGLIATSQPAPSV
jgi:hypothetical protein